MKTIRILAPLAALLAFLPAPVRADIPVVIPPSAEGFVTEPPAEALDARSFQDYPVSHATGSVEISVPLLSFTCGELKMDFGLSYNTEGRSASYGAGRMGLGWSLTGLPQISRQIIGDPDERRRTDIRSGSDKNMTNGYAQTLIDGKVDPFFDIYSYSIPGYSGSFYIETRPDSTWDVRKLPPNGLIITPKFKEKRFPSAIESFSVATPEGVEYKFACRDTVTATSKDPFDELPHVLDGAVSTWNVTEIYAKGSRDTISITYSRAVPYSVSHGSNILGYRALVFEKDEPAGKLPDGEMPKVQGHWTYIRTHVPSRVTCRTATVDFHTRDFGADWAPYRSQITYIDGVTLRDKAGKAVRQASLCYTDTVDRVTVNDNYFTRLSSVTVQAGDTLLDRRTFAYHGARPALGTAESRTGGNIPNGSIWRPNYLWTMAGPWYRLKSIEDARGCTTRLLYRNKTCADAAGDTLYLGQCISSIITTDTVTGRVCRRDFTYSDPQLSIDISALPRSAWVALTGVRRGVRSSTREQNVLMSMTLSSPRAPGVDLSSCAIYYSDIVEEISGTGIDRPLRTRWRYDLSPVIHKIKRVGSMPPLDNNNSMGRYLGRFTLTGKENFGQDIDPADFTPKPLDFYVEKNYTGVPLLTERTVYEWASGGYTPLETETRSWSIHPRQGDSAVVGVSCEALIYQTASDGSAVSPYGGSACTVIKDWRTDVSAFDVTATAYQWLCDTIVTRRHYPDGNHRDITTLIGYDDPGETVMSDTCRRSVFVAALPMTVTTICGADREERSLLYSGNITTGAYQAINGRGYRTLPVIERIVTGGDTLDTRYEYGIFNGMPRLTRQYTTRGGLVPLEERRFTAYDIYGRPTAGIDTDGTAVTWQWETGSDYLASQKRGRFLTTTCASRPLTGYTSVVSPSGKTRHYDWQGGRLVAERNASATLGKWSYGLYADDGVNFTCHETRAGDYAYVTQITRSDGFGQPYLAIDRYGAAANRDLCTAVSYDALGRVTAQTVPTPMYSSTVDTRDITYSRVRGSSSDHRHVYPGHGGTTPARSWLPGNTGNQSTSVERLCNNSSVPMLRCWNFSVSGQTLVRDFYRSNGSLDVSRVTDPDGRVTLTFTDWRGRTVLERRLPASGSDSDSEFIDTYYIHDGLGNLRAVIMPQAVPRFGPPIGQTTPFSSSHLADNSWLYIYDAEGRLSEKRVPGAGAVYYRYDTRGRLAFSQDAADRADGVCRFYLYDSSGREVVTGLYPSRRMPAAGVTVGAMGASLMANPFTATIGSTGYVSPMIVTGEAEVLTARYYDNTSFLGYRGFGSLPGASSVTPRAGMLMAVTERIMRPDAAEAAADSVPQYIHTVFDYDAEERTVRTVSSTERAGEYLTVTTVRDVAGNALAVSASLLHPDGTADRETTTCQYDRLGRPVRRITTRGGASETLADIRYDDRGRPYCTEGASGTFNYLYDVNSRLTGNINEAFGEHLTYTPGGLIAGRRTYRSGEESETRSYIYDGASRLIRVNLVSAVPPGMTYTVPEATYTYDRNSNTTTVKRRGRTDAGEDTPVYGDTDDLTLTYDGNRLVRVTDSASGGSRSDSYDFHDGADESVEYTYDGAGRMTSDLNRGIACVEWNAASQPRLILLDNGDRIEYTYSASGGRLSERLSRPGAGTSVSPLTAPALTETVPAGGSMRAPATTGILGERRFVGPFELEGDSVTRVNVAGGYWNADGLHGYIADWQGNIRAVRRVSDGALIQRTDYYAYGTPSASVGPTANPYKYSGKELETRYGLNFSHHGARLMLNDLTRFATPDPLAELDRGLSPYVYCHADPLNFIDQNGLYPTYDDAYNDAQIRFPGQNVEIHIDKVSGQYYLALNEDGTAPYTTGLVVTRFYGDSGTSTSAFYIINNIATIVDLPIEIQLWLMNLGDPIIVKSNDVWLSRILKGIGKISLHTNVVYALKNIYQYYMRGGEDLKVYAKYILGDIGIPVAASCVPPGIWTPFVWGGVGTYYLWDIKTNGFGLDYYPDNKGNKK